MPWRTSTVETERGQFIVEAQNSEFSHAELCRRYNISRETGYKWLKRFEAESWGGLQNRSSRPRSCSHATSAYVVERILEVHKHFGWGAKKVRRKLLDDPTVYPVPSVDTVHRVLERYDLVEHKKPRRQRSHPGPPLPIPNEPNATWTADFKGQFRTKDSNLCYPLTIKDGFTRFLFDCRGMLFLDLQATIRRFRHLFREFGLPQRIRTDNGNPFSSTAIAGLSQLSVWWIELGITPELIEPASPQQNGRHERFHRTLKDATASPPASDLRAQQQRFNHFRQIYNEERPHEALNLETPASVYQASLRSYSDRPAPLEYPGHYELRLVAGDTTIKWKTRKVFVSGLLKHKIVGLEQLADGLWAVYYGPVRLGWLDEADYRIMDVKERAERQR
jgi:transposase InsO family protein